MSLIFQTCNDRFDKYFVLAKDFGFILYKYIYIPYNSEAAMSHKSEKENILDLTGFTDFSKVDISTRLVPFTLTNAYIPIR